MSLKNQAIVCASVLSGVVFTVAFDAASAPALGEDAMVTVDRVEMPIEPCPVTLRSRSEQAISEVIITADDVEQAFAWVCSEPRELEQGSGTVRECEWVSR